MSRHSSFSRSSHPRPWRSPSTPADSQVSVSLVFAEPEHAIPGGAAAAAATVSHRQQQPREADNSTDTPWHRSDHPDAASSLRKASYTSLRSLNKRARTNSAAPSYSLNSETPSAHPNGAVPTSPSSPESLGADQATTSTSASRQPSQPLGWFSSLGRKPRPISLKPQEDLKHPVDMAGSPEEFSKAVLTPQVNVQPATPELTTFKSTPSSAVAVPFPTSDPEPLSKTAAEVKPRPQVGGWFSGKAASQLTPAATNTMNEASGDAQSSSETLQGPPATNSIARRPSLPQDIPQQKKVGGSTGPEPSTPACPASTMDMFVPSSVDDSVPIVSSFSPPSSPTPAPVRPRERTLSNLSSLNPSSSRFILSMPLLGRPKLPLNQVVAQMGQAGVPIESHEAIKGSKLPEAENLEHVEDAPRGSTISGTGSWWGYIGLGSSSSGDLPSPALPESPSSTADSPSSSSDSPSGTEGPDPSTLRPNAEPEPLTSVSVTSADSVPTWYTPWRWYGGAAAPFDPESRGTGKTEAELVREEALARSGPSSSQSSALASPPWTGSPNPVTTSTESRGSWISFFSSQSITSLNVKTDKEKGEVVDVINLDSADSAVPSSAASGLNTPVTKLPPSPTSKGPPELPTHSPIVPSLTRDDKLKSMSEASRRPRSLSSKKPVQSLPRRANLVLPTFEDTFGTPPRSIPIPQSASAIRRTIRYVSGFLFPDENTRGKGKGAEADVMGRELPRMWRVLGEQEQFASGGLKGVKRVVVIGIHGWFPGSIIRQVIGEPTGTSRKFANMLASAVEDHFNKHGETFEKLTKIVLEGEGTIEQRVNSLFREYLNHLDWVEDLQKADAILLATHSQGSIVSTQLLHRLISEGHIRTQMNGVGVASTPAQRVCCVAMCGIHMGPLLYLNTSSLVNPYIQYFESAAARELFEFQDSESPVSQTYVKALKDVLEHGVKFTYIASLNDQVVPIYSGCFSMVAHPLILRALYIDGDAYNSSDFLSNLLILLLRIRNAGLDDGGLLTHLSEATAGSLSGVGHSSAYEEPATYSLAVRFLFEASGALGIQPELAVQPFTARAARNDYEIPWALRDLIANPDVASLFSAEFSELRAAFDDWHPRTTVLREIRRKFEPIRRLPKSRL